MRKALSGRDPWNAVRSRAAALIAAAVLAVAAGSCGGRGAPAGDGLMIFAAASLRDALTEVAARLRTELGLEAAHNFAGSNVLALQIEASRAADVFLSANEVWMDRIESAGLLVEGTRHRLLGNRLVVVAHPESGWRLDRLEELPDLEFRYLSIADPRAVPAGVYARRLLQAVEAGGTDLWSRVADRLAPAPDVRAALAMVEARRDAVGIVYATDAAASARVRVLASVPEPPAPQIRYSVAVVRPGSPAAAAYLDFLLGPEAGEIFERHGFLWRPADG
ncbi:MAG: molybdate ABC transporter substrate-binding protein [Thermoanaerobaculia bacterium]|nr:molybdate ABC transporter substrate-binding protein [Thermoanaerobaculia bacterium]